LNQYFKYSFFLLSILIFSKKITAQCDQLMPTYIDSVSVDPQNGNIHISWFQNPSAYTTSYEVLMHNPAMNPVWNTITSNNGAGNIYAMLTGYNTDERSFLFNITAIDACSEKSPFTYSISHNTIYIQNEYNSCNREVVLTWNQYNNWQTGVNRYEVWLKENNSHMLLGTTSAGDTTFTATGVNPMVNLDFYVRAVDNSIPVKTSTSNYTRVFTDFPTEPAFTYAKNATVDGNNINFSAHLDASADVEKYLLQRNSGSGFEPLEEFLPSILIGNNLLYTDREVNPGSQSYAYKIITINTCGFPIDTSNVAKTIHLQVQNVESDFKNLLSWNIYESWFGQVESYNIYRSVNGVFSNVATVGANVNQFYDDIFNLYSSTGEFCYYIEAVEGAGNVHGFKEKSNSNKVCVEQKSIVYVANAFMPNGKNAVWKPVFSYTPPDNYRLMIFNRWGEKVFDVQDPNIGWDGDGGKAPAGVYVYRLEFTSEGEVLTKTGTVTIIK
jgi:gliding motility-associated-like protein